jgi:hypothetical protein
MIATTSFAQDVNSFIELLRSDLTTEKKAIITEVMDFSEEEAAVFWPEYRNYELDLAKLGDQRVVLIKDYADNLNTMTDDKAQKLINKAFDFREDRLKLQKEYFNKFSKMLLPAKAAKWVQLENQMMLLIDLQIASELPLVEKPEVSEQK